MIVNGLKIPARLIELIESGRWKCPDDVSVLTEMSGAGYPEGFRFASLDGLIRATAANIELRKRPYGHLYGLTSSNDPNAPRDSDLLDVDRAVLIAGNYDEEVIALDYRENLDEPKVVANTPFPHQGPARWRVIALTFDEFADRLGL